MVPLCIALMTVAIGVSCWILRKVTRIDREVWALKAWGESRLEVHARNVYQQTEALASLYATLHLTSGLPPLGGWAGSPDFLMHIAEHVLRQKPLIVVECSSGVSTLVIARCLQLNGQGHVYSLEHEPQYAEQTRRLLRSHGATTNATVIVAPLHRRQLKGRSFDWYSGFELPRGEIDFLVIDGPPGDAGDLARYPAGPELFPRLAGTAVVFLDDADRPDEQTVVKEWVADFRDMRARRLAGEKGLAVLERC